MANRRSKRQSADCHGNLRNYNCLSQLIVNIVSSILNGHYTASPSAGNHCDRLAAVTAQREQKAIHILIISFDLLNDVFFTFLRIH